MKEYLYEPSSLGVIGGIIHELIYILYCLDFIEYIYVARLLYNPKEIRQIIAEGRGNEECMVGSKLTIDYRGIFIIFR
jgi:hypothetical protein